MERTFLNVTVNKPKKVVDFAGEATASDLSRMSSMLLAARDQLVGRVTRWAGRGLYLALFVLLVASPLGPAWADCKEFTPTPGGDCINKCLVGIPISHGYVPCRLRCIDHCTCELKLKHARGMTRQSDCVAICTSMRPFPKRHECKKKCLQICGVSDDCQVKLDRYIEKWEREFADMKWPYLSADDQSILRVIGDKFLSGFGRFFIRRARGPTSLDVVVVNAGHLRDIATADSDEKKFLASMGLVFDLALSGLPRDGGPDSAGVKIDEVIRPNLQRFYRAMEDRDGDGLRSFVEDQYRRQQPSPCNQIQLPDYKP